MTKDKDPNFEKLCTFMHLGYPPSFIDVALGLAPGTAHDMVIDAWKSCGGILPLGYNKEIMDRYPKEHTLRPSVYTGV